MLEIILYLPFVALFIYMVASVLAKAGLPVWWCIVSIIPIANLIALIAFALIAWPRLPDPKTPTDLQAVDSPDNS